MRVVLSLLALLVAIEAFPYENFMGGEWHLFKTQHKKLYKSQVEEEFRMMIFRENKKKIEEHNTRYQKGLVSFKLKMNHFGDMLHEEFVRTMNGFKRVNVTSENNLGANIRPSYYIQPANVELAKTVDWRTQGAVTPVKNQGSCGSCWAFSSTGALEGQHFRKTGELVSLSEQNLVDCTTRYGNEGCNGGFMDNAFKYIKDNQGLDTERSYPYEGQDDTCRYQPESAGATDSGFVDIPEGDEQQLMAAVATVGPISVAIDASHESFQYYSSGVYSEPQCDSNNLDHAVLIVGYGTEGSEDYWLVKNSWGEGWGEQGYIKMKRNEQNHCGIASTASYPCV